MQKYERGNTMKVTAVFKNTSGALVDPTTPTILVTKPDGDTLYSGAMSQVGTGTYSAEVSTEFTTDIGYHLVQVYGFYGSKRISDAEKVRVVEVI